MGINFIHRDSLVAIRAQHLVLFDPAWHGCFYLTLSNYSLPLSSFLSGPTGQDNFMIIRTSIVQLHLGLLRQEPSFLNFATIHVILVFEATESLFLSFFSFQYNQ